MSIVNEMHQQASKPSKHPEDVPALDHEGLSPGILDALAQVQERIAPVWPLSDYVAVNPYAGFAEQKFLTARQSIRSLSDLETLMPVDYYRQQFEQGAFFKADIDAAVDDLVADGVEGAERIDVNQVIALLREESTPGPSADAEFAKASNPSRALLTFAESFDRAHQSDWGRVIRDEVSKHCAAHYDQGQAAWSSAWQELPLYQAWQNAAQIDRSFEILGVAGFRKLVAGLPQQPDAALVELLTRLRVPKTLWAEVLLCEALTTPGWSAWAKYQHREAELCGQQDTDFAGLLAMRLAYQVALAEQTGFEVDWSAATTHYLDDAVHSSRPTDEELLRLALLRASEIGFRKRLLSGMSTPQNHASLPHLLGSPSLESGNDTERGLAQMVFCIDVRSERIRRHLEATSNEIETFGFAGFFGLPIEFVALGETEGTSQVPALISPKFRIYEEIEGEEASANEEAANRRSKFRFLRKAWKQFQTSAISTFAFVETAGLFFGWKLIARSIGLAPGRGSRFDGVAKPLQDRLAPSLRGLNQQGIHTSQQADLAESVLRGIGIVGNFARLVAFCGHGSQTENNPLQAGLDCGACCGHSGEPNARLAAKLLNQKYIRQALSERGIEVPDDTHFVAALHNTTTDEVEFFDTHELPESHLEDLEQLQTLSMRASKQTRDERLTLLPGENAEDLMRRSADWSEVRPEWGLAGNAAFIAAPRELTKPISLDGRSFLHSYDYRSDTEFAVLEQIMTAPMVVAHWINMQYYASTVDPWHFGSGNKAVHNVVGRFGIFSGNGGDLMTGLPWQSIHDGEEYQHHPLRLLAVIAAPREAIETIIARHEVVANLLTNGWLQLIAIEEGDYFRYTEQQTWVELTTNASQLAAC